MTSDDLRKWILVSRQFERDHREEGNEYSAHFHAGAADAFTRVLGELEKLEKLEKGSDRPRRR